MADIATPLPMYMIGELMGLPEEEAHAQLLHWSDLFATGGSEIRDEVIEAVRAYGAYILEQVTMRRGGAAEDLVSLIANADDEEGPLSDLDLVFETMLVLVGGDETTRHVISGGVEALLRHPDQLARLRRPDAATRRHRGDAAMGQPDPQHEPHGDGRRRGPRPAGASGRPDPAAARRPRRKIQRLLIEALQHRRCSASACATVGLCCSWCCRGARRMVST